LSLRDGRITESGTFAQLRCSGGYVQSLLQNSDTGTSSDDDESLDKDADEVAVEEEVAKKKQQQQQQQQQHKANESKDDSDDARRQLGDGTVYRSYFDSVGVKYVVILLLLEVVWGFLQSFPSESDLSFTPYHPMNTMPSKGQTPPMMMLTMMHW
jgi:ATP-binding cassette subfamily C (CFTR/MRP) protein 1